jgi:signal transduction histidine kinase
VQKTASRRAALGNDASVTAGTNLERGGTVVPLPFNEAERLRALQGYAILDTGPDPTFDRLVEITRLVLGMPIALVNLVDAERQWAKACYGVDEREAGREVSFCAHAILHPDEVMIVPDTLQDERFRDNPMVTMEPMIRFYAGAPLKDRDGFALGTLCVSDRVPRVLSEEDRRLLSDLACVVVDELELWRTSLELRRANAEVRRADEAKTAFLANVNHELRTPITSTLLALELLQDGALGDLEPTQVSVLGDVRKANEHLLVLVNDLLDVARMELGRLEVRLQLTDVAAVLRESLDLVREGASRAGVRLLDEVQPLPPVFVDPTRIKQVATNLLANAVRFTPAGGSITLRSGLSPDESTVLFEVSDTGAGIAPEDQERLFQPFVQGRQPEEKRREGVGLGLALARRLVEAHGGSISLESAPGAGSTFRVCLPRSAAHS